MTLFEGNLPQNDRERETKKKEKKESERVGCQMIWQVPETEHRRLNFPHRFCPFCERTWFTPSLYNELSCMVPGYRFWGGAITLQCFMHISDKKLLQYYSGLQPFWPWLMYIDNIDIPDSELLPPNWIATWFFWFELVRSGELHVDTWSKKKTGHDWPREYGWDVFGYLARVLIYGNRGACDTRTSINFVVINIFGWSSSIFGGGEYTIPGPNPHVICNWDLPVTYLAVQPLGLQYCCTQTDKGLSEHVENHMNVS